MQREGWLEQKKWGNICLRRREREREWLDDGVRVCKGKNNRLGTGSHFFSKVAPGSQDFVGNGSHFYQIKYSFLVFQRKSWAPIGVKLVSPRPIIFSQNGCNWEVSGCETAPVAHLFFPLRVCTADHDEKRNRCHIFCWVWREGRVEEEWMNRAYGGMLSEKRGARERER